jgi:hypothetical protein
MCILLIKNAKDAEYLSKDSPKMAKKPGKKSHALDLDQSIQVALDAAEASMDVTTEFGKVSKQFESTTASVQKLQKISRNGIIAAACIAILSIALMGAIWQRSSAGLQRLAAMNTELLSMLTENVSSLEKKVKLIEEFGDKMGTLSAEMKTLKESTADISASTSEIGMLRASVAQMTIDMTGLVTEEAANLRSEELVSNVGDRIATLNGELAMTVSLGMQDTLTAQMEDYQSLVKDVSKALDAVNSGPGSDSVAALQKKMDVKVNDLNMRINQLKKARAKAPTKRARAAQQPDVIKYP